MSIKIGLIREGKTPPDKRVPLTPKQCKEIKAQYGNKIELVVQSSPIRAYRDEEYLEEGIAVVQDISDCDIILGVKEVPLDMLVPGKTHLFFSHTIKKQPYNRKLLLKILDTNIRLIDYEVVTNKEGVRLIGFGKYAGIVGAYNGLLAYGKKFNAYQLKPAHECFDRKEMEEELTKINLPNDFKIVLTGAGRVAGGAIETLNKAGIKKVSADEILNSTFDVPVYAQLTVTDYNKRKDGTQGTREEFFKNPEIYEADFNRFTKVTDLFIPCHYWDSKAPFILTQDDLKATDNRIKIVADISCDIAGPIASTIRPSTIAEPHYGYNPENGKEVEFMDTNAIGVMAVDNLPCELPRDASLDFGKELMQSVLPGLIDTDIDDIIKRATIAEKGNLTSYFENLTDYVKGE
jgi:saccharopine dehydrogenase (NAD+, L-lysine forming)